MAQTGPLTIRKPIRVWPGVVAAALIVLIVFALGGIVNETFTNTCTTIKAKAALKIVAIGGGSTAGTAS